MFGINDSQVQDDPATAAHATVVTQSNMTLPDEGAPSLPDEWHAPSKVNEQTLAPAPIVSPASNTPAPSLPPQPTVMASTAAIEPAPVEIASVEVPLVETKVEPKGSPELKLDNAYIPTDPGPPVSKASEPVKPTAASLMDDNPEDELVKMKQKALQSLAPLVDHLEQSPEEKFKTTMMLIQASDNAELVKDAYEAANQIEDEKVRAQALLDVVNEINYFTHHNPVGNS